MFFLFIQAAVLFFLTSSLQAETINVDEGIYSSSSHSVCAFAPRHYLTYIASNNTENPTFSLSSLTTVVNKKGQSLGFKAEGLVPEEVILDYKEDEKNPLFGKTIKAITLIENKPVVVTQEQPSLLYYLQSVGKTMSLLSTPKLHDADGNETAGIIKMCAAAQRNHYIIAAVKKQNGFFGQSGSGLALVKLNFVEIPSDEDDKKEVLTESEPQKNIKTQAVLDVLDAQSGDSKANKAIDVTQCSDAFSIQGGLGSIEPDSIDMHWDPRLGRCYIALQVTTANTATDQQGVCALASATIVNDTLVIQPMVFHAAIQGATIVSATGPGQQVSLHKVRTLHTSTGLTYLVVVGGNGAPEQTNKQVSALPLLVAGNADVLAAKKSEIQTIYKGRPEIIFDHREFIQPAERPGDLPSAHDTAVAIGAGVSLPSAVTDIAIVQDAVYVTVAQSTTTGESGVYHSQPIFDGTGAIAAWTPWQRVIQSDFSLIGVDLNPSDGSFLLLEKEKTEQGCRIMMRKTGWKYHDVIAQSAEKEGVIDFTKTPRTLEVVLDEEFDQQDGGIQGLFDFPATHKALRNNLSLIVATGYKKVIIAQTSSMHNGSCKAFAEPVISQFVDGDIEKLGPITAATIAHNGTQAWLFVAGAEGVAVLCNSDGSGWSLANGLQNGLVDLASMSFKKIGSHNFVQKLMSDGTSLYILTKRTLERVDLAAESMVSGPLRTYCIANGIKLFDTYGCGLSDAGVSGSCALLATSRGLFISDEQSDCSQAKSLDDMQWQSVALPVEGDAVRRLFFVTPTSFENDFSQHGQVYVVAHASYAKSRIYRFYTSNNRIVPVPDHFRKQQAHDYFCSFGSLATFFVTDGSLYMHAQNSTATTQPDLTFLPEDITGGKGIHTNFSKRASLHIENSERINAIGRNWATGGWMIAGDFGLRITQ